MKNKLYLTRDSDGDYTLWRKKPEFKLLWGSKKEGMWEKGYRAFSICSFWYLTEYLRLKKHLPKGKKGIAEITINPKCKRLFK